MLGYDDATGTLTVAPEGELDHYMAQNMRGSIDAMILKTDAGTLTFDMSNVSFMDSSGIGMIIGRYKLMKKRGGRVKIRGMRMPLERIFRMSGLAQIIILESQTDAAQTKTAVGAERKENK